MKRSSSLRRDDFQTVWDKGKSSTYPLLILRARVNGREANRYGFVVGKKVGNAARRNRVKRWMREAVRHRAERIAQGWDVIFIARARPDAEFKEMDSAIEQALTRARLYSSPDSI